LGTYSRGTPSPSVIKRSDISKDGQISERALKEGWEEKENNKRLILPQKRNGSWSNTYLDSVFAIENTTKEVGGDDRKYQLRCSRRLLVKRKRPRKKSRRERIFKFGTNV